MIPALSDFKGMAQRQIQRHGVECTYVLQTQGVYNPETSSISGGSSQTYTFKAFPAKASFTETQQPNLVGVDTKVFMVAAADLPVKPEVNSKITAGIDSYTVLSVVQHCAHGQVTIWRLLCKEG